MTLRRMAVLGVCLALVSTAAATELISNLPGNDGTQTADLNNLRCKGMGFTMPSGLGYTLDSATLRLETFGPNIEAIVEIWDDVAGLPGKSLTTLVNPAFAPSGIANYDFTPASPFTLEADTDYFLVAYGTAGGDRVDWKGSSPAQIPTGLATHGSVLWGTSGPPPTSPSSIVVSYALNGTIVPEPASLTLLAFAGLALIRRR